MLDLANNTLQGPCRALVADLASESQRNAGNAFFSMWMAVGNVLGYSTGASGMASRLLPRAIIFSPACSGPCANLKVGAHLVSFDCAMIYFSEACLKYQCSSNFKTGVHLIFGCHIPSLTMGSFCSSWGRRIERRFQN
jgi:hypothetical protein